MNRWTALSLLTVPLLAVPLVGGPAVADSDRGRPARYQLTGDPEGSKFEGIGADQRRGVFYVSEVTGGEIHRGTAGSAQTSEWLPAGADDRFTARGITVDKAGRVYIAGGPNGQGTGRPDRREDRHARVLEWFARYLPVTGSADGALAGDRTAVGSTQMGST